MISKTEPGLDDLGGEKVATHAQTSSLKNGRLC